MATARPSNLLPFTSAIVAQRFGFPLKLSVILIRWPVVIICTYLLLYPSIDLVPLWFSYGAILLYIGSNIGLYFFAEERFASWSFYYPLVIADTIVLTLSLVANGYSETEFYLTFFVVILGSCIIENAKIRTIVSVAAPLFYSVTLFTSAADLHPTVFLRLPFLFVVSLFYGYFTQFIRMGAFVKRRRLEVAATEKSLEHVSHEFETVKRDCRLRANLRDKNLGRGQRGTRATVGKFRSRDHYGFVNEVLDGPVSKPVKDRARESFFADISRDRKKFAHARIGLIALGDTRRAA